MYTCSAINNGVTTMTFTISYKAVTSGPCKSMSLDTIQLFYDDDLTVSGCQK